MKDLADLDLPALRALTKRVYFHETGSKDPKRRQDAATQRRTLLSHMKAKEAVEVRTST